MIITSRKELKFCIMADRMMSTGSFRRPFPVFLKELFLPNWKMKYLSTMRKLSYYKHKGNPLWLYYHFKYQRLTVKLGFTIGPDVFGYGLSLPHYGTIVVGSKNSIGNYAMIHVCTLIPSTDHHIGDNFYLATGAKVTTGMNLGKNVTIAANSVVTKSFDYDNVLLAGMPAVVKGERGPWWEADESFVLRHQRCEELRASMFP